MVGILCAIIQYKRPIMSINCKPILQTTYLQAEAKIHKLKIMLALNRQAQAKLFDIKAGIQRRWRQLEEVGSLPSERNQQNNQIFDCSSAIVQIRKMPPLLQDQLLLKKNAAQQYGFLKNITQQKQSKPSKPRMSKLEKVNLKNLGTNPRAINFVEKGQVYGKSGLQLYRDWREVHEVQASKSLMSQDPNETRLIEKRKIYGDNWEKIGCFFNGLKFDKLYYYYQNNLSNAEPGKWTLSQNLMLIALVECYGYGKWAAISKKMRVKSEFQIRERFCNVLDPSIKQNNWTEQEEKLLLEVANENEYKWSKIVKNVPQLSTKTDNAIRRKFRNLMIKYEDQQIRELIKNKKLEDSIIKFKKSYFNRNKKGKEPLSAPQKQNQMMQVMVDEANNNQNGDCQQNQQHEDNHLNISVHKMEKSEAEG